VVESQAPRLSDANMDRLVKKVIDARGFDLSRYRRAYVERRIAARMRSVGATDFRSYAAHLDANDAEYTKLIDALSINVTEFFRDVTMWSMLRQRVLPELVERKVAGRSRSIRAWSAGCASGEEPYSIAMCLREALGPMADEWLLTVLATDLDRDALDTGERGVYPAAALKKIPPVFVTRYTKRDPEEFTFTPELKKMVRFRAFSLFSDTPIRVVDLIMCRNVLIYFDKAQQQQLIEHFWHALARGGYLVLGKSEKAGGLQIAADFETIDGPERIYRKPTRI